ncbi:hypothetical protein GCM10009863_30490 [Streptomyces axinellae]|uniref:Uncharacterized protein n=1 Tax=Streptomyces axinellae TaxID=552788 RepID=A0ABN3Q3R3_9ACTN
MPTGHAEILKNDPGVVEGDGEETRRGIAHLYTDSCINVIAVIVAFAIALAVPVLRYYSLPLLILPGRVRRFTRRRRSSRRPLERPVPGRPPEPWGHLLRGSGTRCTEARCGPGRTPPARPHCCPCLRPPVQDKPPRENPGGWQRQSATGAGNRKGNSRAWEHG